MAVTQGHRVPPWRDTRKSDRQWRSGDCVVAPAPRPTAIDASPPLSRPGNESTCGAAAPQHGRTCPRHSCCRPERLRNVTASPPAMKPSLSSSASLNHGSYTDDPAIPAAYPPFEGRRSCRRQVAIEVAMSGDCGRDHDATPAGTPSYICNCSEAQWSRQQCGTRPPKTPSPCGSHTQATKRPVFFKTFRRSPSPCKKKVNATNTQRAQRWCRNSAAASRHKRSVPHPPLCHNTTSETPPPRAPSVTARARHAAPAGRARRAAELAA